MQDFLGDADREVARGIVKIKILERQHGDRVGAAFERHRFHVARFNFFLDALEAAQHHDDADGGQCCKDAVILCLQLHADGLVGTRLASPDDTLARDVEYPAEDERDREE